MTETTFTGKWQRIDTGSTLGYRSGDYWLNDNGAGVGSAKGSGRWAVMLGNTWLANIDTLAEAKQYATDHQAKGA